MAIRQPLIITLVENAFTAKGNEKENFYKTVSGVERTYEVTAEYSSDLKIVSLSFYDTTEAVQANQMKRDFVANVSHELKSPLTSILGFIETLTGVIESNPLKANQFLRVMERESLRMSRLIDDLLGLSRVEAAEKPGKVWSRDALLDRVWGRGIYVDTRTVDVHIGRLRRSLCKNGEEDLVRTVRGAGYALG